MKKEMRNKLLDKYYKGETTLEEENHLKSEVLLGNDKISEKDIFGYFQKESVVPEDIEKKIFEGIKNEKKKKTIVKTGWLRLTSAAATILILLTAYLGYRETRNAKIENEFLIMEQALLQVSQRIQPEEQKEMFVLWLDDDVEIIIN